MAEPIPHIVDAGLQHALVFAGGMVFRILTEVAHIPGGSDAFPTCSSANAAYWPLASDCAETLTAKHNDASANSGPGKRRASTAEHRTHRSSAGMYVVPSVRTGWNVARPWSRTMNPVVWSALRAEIGRRQLALLQPEEPAGASAGDCGDA